MFMKICVVTEQIKVFDSKFSHLEKGTQCKLAGCIHSFQFSIKIDFLVAEVDSLAKIVGNFYESLAKNHNFKFWDIL